MVRQRAVGRQDKEARREALLDAAERLLAANPRGVPNVSEVADAAGVAKGTVYLYFASKERLLLALHERQIEAFFGALAEFLDPHTTSCIDDVPERVLAWLADHPVFVVLAARWHGAGSRVTALTVAEVLNARTGDAAAVAADRLAHGVAGPRGESALALVWQSLALVIGLVEIGRPREIASAMRTLWRGYDRNAAGREQSSAPGAAGGAADARDCA